MYGGISTEGLMDEAYAIADLEFAKGGVVNVIYTCVSLPQNTV